MGSATSCIALEPVEWSRIYPSSQILNVININEFTRDPNAIRFAVVEETNMAKSATEAGARAISPNLTGLKASVWNF